MKLMKICIVLEYDFCEICNLFKVILVIDNCVKLFMDIYKRFCINKIKFVFIKM